MGTNQLRGRKMVLFTQKRQAYFLEVFQGTPKEKGLITQNDGLCTELEEEKAHPSWHLPIYGCWSLKTNKARCDGFLYFHQ